MKGQVFVVVWGPCVVPTILLRTCLLACCGCACRLIFGILEGRIQLTHAVRPLSRLLAAVPHWIPYLAVVPLVHSKSGILSVLLHVQDSWPVFAVSERTRPNSISESRNILKCLLHYLDWTPSILPLAFNHLLLWSNTPKIHRIGKQRSVNIQKCGWSIANRSIHSGSKALS